MNDQIRTPITGVVTVGIPVTDQDRALDFYVGVLGLEQLMDIPLEQLGGRWIVVTPIGAETSLALVPAQAGAPAGVPTGIRLATSDAAALREELLDRHVSVGELLGWPGVPPMFTVTDPDGNGLSITELPRDGAAH
jgi:lactoylglutathione lyase